jgi:hypothetical protein
MADGGVVQQEQDKVGMLMRRFENAVSQRANWESLWQDIGERVFPNSAFFTSKNLFEGERKTQRLFDSTAPLALQRFAASLQWMLIPDSTRWHKLKPRDRRLNQSPVVKRYFDDLNDALFEARYNQRANFSSQYNQAFQSIGAFGNGAVLVDEKRGQHLIYTALHMSECYVLVNSNGVVDTVFRPFSYTARQAAEKAEQDGWKLPESITTAAKDTPDKPLQFLQAIYPNPNMQTWRRDAAGMAFASCYIAIDSRQIVSEGGYRTFPVMVGRYNMAPREVYGRSPAMDAFPTILTLNEQKKTVLRAGQRAVDPPLLLSDDGALSPFDMRSSAMNYGTLARDGEPLVKPLMTGARIDIGLDLMQDERKTINDHFLVTLFQILVDTPEMTATEAMLRAQEKGALLAPTMGRLQSGMVAPLIDRELDLLGHAGELPQPPDELIAAGAEYEVEYDTELTRAQKAGQGVSVLKLFSAVAPLAEAKPDVLDKLDIDAGLDVLADVYGVPAKVVRSPEEVQKLRDARAKQAQLNQVLEAAPVAAGAAKDLAQAQQIAGAAPPVPLPA